MQPDQAEITQQNPQLYLISGTVNFSTVSGLLLQLLRYLSAAKASGSTPITIDLAKVEECNSAALALILETAKSAGQKNIQLKYQNLPDAALTIAKAYGVENEIRELCE